MKRILIILLMCVCSFGYANQAQIDPSFSPVRDAKRCGQRAFIRPPEALHPNMQGPLSNPDDVGPIRQYPGFAVERQGSVLASVATLFCGGRPSAIPRLVIPIVADPLKGVLGSRLRPHVGIECGEVVDPPFADGNPAAAVVVECRIVRDEAPALHLAPGGVFRRMVSLPQVAVSVVGLPSPFQATARGCFPGSKLGLRDDSAPPTITLADPSALLGVRWFQVFRDSDEPSEALTDEGKKAGAAHSLGSQGSLLSAGPVRSRRVFPHSSGLLNFIVEGP